MSQSRGHAGQLALPWAAPPRSPAGERRTPLVIAGRAFDVTFVRHRRARHYILRVVEDGGLRVTIPRGGSQAEAERFVHARRAWIERERYRRALDEAARGQLGDGSLVLFRGVPTRLNVTPVDDGRLRVTFADEVFTTDAAPARLRTALESYLRALATRELSARLTALAATHGLRVAAVSIRNQRSRWGSCSPSGGISLNWRLIQFPPDVADYVMLHELAHLRHLNHSSRFWKEVERMCPGYRDARAWLRTNYDVRAAGL